MKKLVFSICSLMLTGVLAAQDVETTPLEDLTSRTQTLESTVETLKKIKLSGYAQFQGQWGEKDASLKVGGPNENPAESFNRIGIRRGRIKLAYTEGIMTGVFQLDITEKTGVTVRDAYFDLQPKWFGAGSLRSGMFNRPFGDEIGYSSSIRECPERSTITQTLFPGERDLGAMLTFQANKTSPWNIVKLEAGLFGGNGSNPETDSKRDLISHLSIKKALGNTLSLGGGVSYYSGHVFQSTQNVYTMVGDGFVLNNDAANKNKFAKREYYGVDAQVGLMGPLGLTQIRGEYLFGQQPGSADKTVSPTTAPTSDTYIRDFAGGYVIVVQALGKLPVAAVAKYDFYDPNTKVSGDQIGANGTSKKGGDVAVNTLGVGGIWRISNAIRLQAFYEFNKYETNKLASLEGVKRDMFTLRLQVKY